MEGFTEGSEVVSVFLNNHCGAENYWRKQDHVGDGSDLDQSGGSGGLTSVSMAKLLQV